VEQELREKEIMAVLQSPFLPHGNSNILLRLVVAAEERGQSVEMGLNLVERVLAGMAAADHHHPFLVHQ
jgi:hypothetical protein